MGRPLPPEFANALESAVVLPTLQVGALEVTQVIQDLQHSVPLIAGKGTVVRVYLSSPDSSVSVRGELTVTPAGGAARKVTSVNAVSVAKLPSGGVPGLREQIASSLNFRLPDELVQPGSIEASLSALTYTNGAGVKFTNAVPVQVTFVATAPLRVRLLGLRYQSGTPAQAFEPRELDYQAAASWLLRAYPVSETILSRSVVDIPDRWPFDCNVANAFLTELRRQDMANGGDARTHYFGLVSDGAGFMRGCASDVPSEPAPDTVASGPAGANSWGWDNDGSYADWYTGHELGHTFGRKHPGFCNGNSPDDSNFPYADGQLSNSDGAFVGLDVGDAALGLPMVAVPGQTWHDVMTYCERQWMSAYTYRGIRDRLMEENPGFPAPGAVPQAALESASLPPAAQPLVHVVALVELEKMTGRIRSVKPVSAGRPSRREPNSDAVLQVLGADDDVLNEQPIRIKISTCCEGETDTGLIDALLVSPAGAKQVRLLLDGAEADRFPRRNARTAALESAAAPQYFLQASRDDGQTWETIATRVSPQSSTLDHNPFPGVRRVLTRVLKTDGFSMEENSRTEQDFAP